MGAARPRAAGLLAILAVASAALAKEPPTQLGQDPATEPDREPAGNAFVLAEAGADQPADRGAAIDTVQGLLEALETADANLRTLQTGIMYDRRFELQGDRHIRFGDLYFRSEPGPAGGPPGARASRTFAVRFNTLIIDDVRRNEATLWLFDGQWLIEKREADKQYIARQIARPDQPIDPLRLGEGPIPLPIGQKKADILARYTAELLPPESGLLAPTDADQDAVAEADRLISNVENTYQLRLVPRAERARDDDFQEIRLWYLKGSLLPRMARTVNRAGDTSIVLLINARTNEPLPEGVMSIKAPRPEEGWTVQVDEGHFQDGPAPARDQAPAPGGANP